MAQKQIDFGAFPNDPGADPIRAAFQKVQDNFTDLYNTSFTAGVQELRVGPGLGINRNTGNVTISTNLPNITINTGNSLVVGTGGTPTGNTLTIQTYTTPFKLDLASNISTVNGTFTGLLTVANLSMTGFVTTSILPAGNNQLDLGSFGHRWKDLYLSGTTITIGTQTISSSPAGVVVSTGVITANLNVGNVTATTVTANSANIANNLTANTVTSNTVAAVNLSVTNITPTPGSPPPIIAAPGSDTQLIFNRGGNSSAASGLSYDYNASILTLSGNLQGGNVNTSGGVAATGNVNGGNLTTAGLVAATGNVSGGNLVTIGILSAQGNVVGGNLVTEGFLTVTGNASVGNITSVNSITGAVISMSGNISGANLVASGILRVDGNANVGNLTTSGVVSAATLAATSANLTGNINAGNVITSGEITANVLNGNNIATPGNVSATGNASITGNVTSGNVTSAAGTHTANSFVGNLLGITGNITSGNILSLTGVHIANAFSGNNATIQNDINVTSGNVISANGTHTANAFTGNAANIVGTILSGNVSSTTGTHTANAFTGNIANIIGTVTSGNVTSILGTHTANAFTGNTATIAQDIITTSGNVTSLNGIHTANSFVGNVATIATLNADVLNGNNISTPGNASVTGNATITGNVSANNATFGNIESLTGTHTANAFAGNVVNVATNLNMPAGSTLSLNGNLAGNTIYASGLINATGDIFGNANITANALLSVVGTATLGNVVSNGGLNVTNSASINRSLSIGSNITTTGASNVAGNAVVTFSSQSFPPFAIGQTILVSGIVPAIFNGSKTVLNCNTTAVVYTANSGTAGPQTVAGTITNSGTAFAVVGNSGLSNVAISGLLTTSLDANMANITIKSSNTLSVLGTANLTTLNTNGAASFTGATTTISNLVTTLDALIGNTANPANANVSGNINAGNISTNGSLSANILNGNNISTPGNANIGGGNIMFYANGFANVVSQQVGVLTATSAANFQAGFRSSGDILGGGNSTTYGLQTVGANIQLTGIIGNGTVATATYAAQTVAPFIVGQNITISGVTGIGAAPYNGPYIVRTSNATATTYNMVSGPTTAGTVTSAFITNSGTGLLVTGSANASSFNGNTLNSSGNVNAGTLYSRGILQVDNNATINGQLQTPTAITTGTHTVGSTINVGARLVIRSIVGAAGTVTIVYDAQPYAPFNPGQIVSVTGITGLVTLNETNKTVVTANITHLTYTSSIVGSGTVSAASVIFASGLGLNITGSANVNTLNSSTANITGTVTAGGLDMGTTGNAAGNVFTARTFSGNGSGITYVLASAISGTVTSATTADTAGSADAATKLATARNINGVLFDGSGDITITSVGTVTNAAQTNITSVGTLTGLAVNGNITTGNFTSNGYTIRSVAGISAAGTNLATATALGKDINLVSTGSAGQGVRLPGATVGMTITVINITGVALNVYPEANAKIDGLTANSALALGSSARLQFVSTAINQWYSLIGTYG
jgi:hypothetical protein